MFHSLCQTTFDKSTEMVPYKSQIYQKKIQHSKIRGLDVQEVITILENVKAVDQHEEHQHQIKMLQKQAKNAQKASKSSRKKYGQSVPNPNKRSSITCFADRQDAELFEEFKKEMWELADMRSGFMNLDIEYEEHSDMRGESEYIPVIQNEEQTMKPFLFTNANVTFANP